MKSYNNYLILIASRLFSLGIVFFTVLILPLLAEAAILQNLKRGNRNSSVLELQKILNLDPETRLSASGPGSPGNETDYFGPITYAAVRRFQQKYSAEILAPISLTAPTGFVGPQTRHILNLLAPSLAPIPTASPSIFQVKPIITAVTPQIITQSPIALTITGTNFTPTGNTVYITSEPRYAYANLPSRDNKIELNFRASGVEDLKTQLSTQLPPTEYDDAVKDAVESIIERIPGTSQVPTILQIINANGESAPFTLLIDVEAILLAK
jgi:peptidoglycan hydrolase-like protein with peptidoglycan-binding domain